MKKEGDWIAALSGKLEVSRVDVEANEVLDLVEVTEIDRVTGRPTSVRFFDRVEGARLCDQLHSAVARLEDDDAPYEAVFVEDGRGKRDTWTVAEKQTGATVDCPVWRGPQARLSASEWAADMNAGRRPTDHKRGAAGGP